MRDGNEYAENWRGLGRKDYARNQYMLVYAVREDARWMSG